MGLDVQPIEDVSSEESYIQDLELEVETLRAELKVLKQKPKPTQQLDINCCEAYKLVLRNFHKLIDDIIPF